MNDEMVFLVLMSLPVIAVWFSDARHTQKLHEEHVATLNHWQERAREIGVMHERIMKSHEELLKKHSR
jgi:hypothetical protein